MRSFYEYEMKSKMKWDNFPFERIGYQTEDIIQTALILNIGNIVHVKNPKIHHWKYVLEHSGSLLPLLPKQTEELCMIAVKSDPYAIRHVKKQTERICIEAIRLKPEVIEFIRVPIKGEILLELISVTI